MGDGRARLQRHRDGTGNAERDVDGRVVDAGEAQYADPVTGGDPVGQRAGHLADPVGQLAVSDLVEPGQQLGGSAPGLWVCHQLIRPLRQRGPVGITLQRGLDDRGQVRPGGIDGVADGLVRSRGRELGIGGGQLRGALFLDFFGVCRHTEPHNVRIWEI